VQIKALPAEAQEEAMKLLIAAACIDGQIAPEEREYLKTMGGALGIPEGILTKRLAHQLGDATFTL
jgi:tellurite resistance protein